MATFTRPYDAPLADTVGPVRAAMSLRRTHGAFARIVASPYRRCVQSATLVAAVLGIDAITLDNRLGEFMPNALRSWRPLMAGGAAPPPITLMTRAEAEFLTIPLALTWDRDAHPLVSYGVDDIGGRVAAAVAEHAVGEGSALLVTHGDVVNRYLPALFEGPDADDVGRYAVDECGWAIVRGPFGPRVADPGDIVAMAGVTDLFL